MEPGPYDDATHGRKADESGLRPGHLAEGAERDRTDRRRDPDRRERRAGRDSRSVADEEDQERDCDDAAAHAEERAEEPCRDADPGERPAEREPRAHERIVVLEMDAEAVLAPLTEAPRETALVFDVDGVLAPMAARPELACVPEETKAELRRLAREYLLVACVSGRAGDDAARLVGVEGVRCVGNHGLELDPRAEEFAALVARFRATVEWPVEDKRLSLTYHYREVADEEAARAELGRVAQRAREEGLVPRWGRKVLEIRPPVDADKGTALVALLVEAGARRALYAGDDATDLDAFAGLDRARLDHAVRVAVSSAEGPPQLRAAADLVVASPEACTDVLRAL